MDSPTILLEADEGIHTLSCDIVQQLTLFTFCLTGKRIAHFAELDTAIHVNQILF